MSTVWSQLYILKKTQLLLSDAKLTLRGGADLPAIAEAGHKIYKLTRLLSVGKVKQQQKNNQTDKKGTKNGLSQKNTTVQ